MKRRRAHSAAVVGAQIGAVIAELTIGADPDGYQDLLDLAIAHGHRHVWSIEGTGGYGAGLARFLLEACERVIELAVLIGPRVEARPSPTRIDAVRAAREALGRTKLTEPKVGGERTAIPKTYEDEGGGEIVVADGYGYFICKDVFP